MIELHADGIEEHGGRADLREWGALDSAVAQPRASFDGTALHPTPADKAAAYLFYIVKAHAFMDGNKRVAARAALVFLDINGFQVTPGQWFTDMVYALVTDEITLHDAAQLLERNMTPHEPLPPVVESGR